MVEHVRHASRDERAVDGLEDRLSLARIALALIASLVDLEVLAYLQVVLATQGELAPVLLFLHIFV
jgi:hypothetical protein